jgi:Protein of unknown function (DUF2778)
MRRVRFSIGIGRLSAFDDSDVESDLGPAYAGKPPHVNDANACFLKGVGPLPKGLYTIGKVGDWPESVGYFALPLQPNATNNMYDREGFYVHGDNPFQNQTASDGCIVASHPIRMVVAQYNLLEVVS